MQPPRGAVSEIDPALSLIFAGSGQHLPFDDLKVLACDIHREWHEQGGIKPVSPSLHMMHSHRTFTISEESNPHLMLDSSDQDSGTPTSASSIHRLPQVALFQTGAPPSICAHFKFKRTGACLNRPDLLESCLPVRQTIVYSCSMPCTDHWVRGGSDIWFDVLGDWIQKDKTHLRGVDDPFY